MGGGLMQLVAYGAQDIYLTGNPQITFFKVVYRRHTNFSMETIEQTINGTSTLSASATTSGTVTISRNGDLVHKIYVTSSTSSIQDGMALVDEVELEIGGQRIDKHTKEWNQIWAELSTPESKALGYKAMTGSVGSSGTTGVGMVQVPLNFWFCRNPGLALPLIALQYHEVKLKFTWGKGTDTVGANAGCKVHCDYIYLDTDERRRFAQVSHEYLIEQVQYFSKAGATGSAKLNFNHPVKELVWTSDQDYTNAKLVLNGHDRFAAQEKEYFQLRQPMDHHTAIPLQNVPGLASPNLQNTTLVVNATGVATAYDANTDVATNTFIALSAAGTIAADSAVGSRKFVQLAEEQVGAFVVGNKYLVYHHDADVVNDTTISFATCTSVGAAGTGSAKSIGFDVDIHSGGDSETGDVLRIFALGTNSSGLVPARTSQLTDKINCYSFALKPEEHQPSGTCNFSRIDNAQLNFTASPHSSNMNIYAVNYNVLRVMSGMGGLAYSN
jgi:hypothetical protein